MWSFALETCSDPSKSPEKASLPAAGQNSLQVLPHHPLHLIVSYQPNRENGVHFSVSLVRQKTGRAPEICSWIRCLHSSKLSYSPPVLGLFTAWVTRRGQRYKLKRACSFHGKPCRERERSFACQILRGDRREDGNLETCCQFPALFPWPSC